MIYLIINTSDTRDTHIILMIKKHYLALQKPKLQGFFIAILRQKQESRTAKNREKCHRNRNVFCKKISGIKAAINAIFTPSEGRFCVIFASGNHEINAIFPSKRSEILHQTAPPKVTILSFSDGKIPGWKDRNIKPSKPVGIEENEKANF